MPETKKLLELTEDEMDDEMWRSIGEDDEWTDEEWWLFEERKMERERKRLQKSQ